MKFANLLMKIYYDVWFIRPDKHAAIGRLLQEYMQHGEIVGPKDGWGDPIVQQMEVHNGIAWIPVHGVLGKHLSNLELMCGGCDYAHVAEFTRRAVEDGSVHTLLYDIDSPGGMGIGLPELCAQISRAGERKRTLTYVDMQCCSAGYWLASQTGEIFASESAQIGCIGSYIAGLDNSREWEMSGWKLELFKSGKLKALGVEGKQWTDEERAFLQAKVDKHAAKFRASVAARRPDVAPESMEGAWYDGDEAEDRGLIDRVKDFEDVASAILAAEVVMN